MIYHSKMKCRWDIPTEKRLCNYCIVHHCEERKKGELGDTIYLEIRKKGYSVNGVANAIGVSASLLSAIRKGKRELTPRIARLIEEELGLPTGYLKKNETALY